MLIYIYIERERERERLDAINQTEIEEGENVGKKKRSTCCY